MIQLAYVSSAAHLLTFDDIGGLLIKSRESNQRVGITGILLYKDGNLLQIIEGEPAPVRNLFDRISADPRHHGIIRLYEKEISEREFPDWTMAFQDLRDEGLTLLEGYSDFLDPAFDLTKVKPSQAMTLVGFFRRRG